jgi:fatty-acyl-CoA synthase
MSPSAPLSPPSEFAPPFSATTRVTSLADVRQIEATPLSEALTVRSTYEIFRNSAHTLWRQNRARPFCARPTRPKSPSAGRTASCWPASTRPPTLLHALGVGPAPTRWP